MREKVLVTGTAGFIGFHMAARLLAEGFEAALGRKAVRNNREIQPGDVPVTHADVSALEAWVGFKPRTTIEEGIREFVKWYLEMQGKWG